MEPLRRARIRTWRQCSATATERIRLKRRQFSALATTAALGLGLHRGASAQGDTPITAADYTRMGTPVPVSTPPGTVDGRAGK